MCFSHLKISYNFAEMKLEDSMTFYPCSIRRMGGSVLIKIFSLCIFCQ